MIRATLASMRLHARRMVGTAVAVILGVGFVAGTLIFDDTARAGFFGTYSRAAQHVDVAVEPAAPAGKDQPAALTAAQVAAVRAVPHVGAVDARTVQPLALLDRRGRPITNFDTVGMAVSTDGDPLLRAFDVSGRVPAGPGEVALDTETAAYQRYRIGDAVTVLDRSGGRHGYHIVGLIDFGTSKRFSGQSVVGLPTGEIQALTGTNGYDEVVLSARGVTPAALAAEVRGAVGGSASVVTGDQRRLDLANQAVQVADQMTIVLLVFGVISLIVAAFVIYNTFAILLAQRIRETALLRCVGATRRQVFGGVLLESTLVGLVGAVAGIVLGIGVCYALLGLLNGPLHAGVPVHAVVLHPTPVLAGLAIGLGVTVAAAFLPAVRATRTSPLAALRDTGAGIAGVRAAVWRAVSAALVGTGGVALTWRGTHAADVRTGTFTIVAGGVVTFLAVLLLAPLFVGPLTALLGAVPARLFGTPARLATANARRNPGRTAVTAGALMIGIGLISLFSVLIASLKATGDAQIRGHYPVDYVMTGLAYGDGRAAGIPPGYAQAVRQQPQFAAVGRTREVDGTLDGRGGGIVAVDPGSVGTLVQPQMTRGSLADLRPGTAVVRGARGGDSIVVRVGGRSQTLRVVGSTSSTMPGGSRFDVLITWSDLTALAGPGDDTTVLVKAAPHVTPTASRDALDALSGGYPQVEVNSTADLSSDLDHTVNGLIALFAGLVGTAVLISLFGIANTLSLSVVERTRESATVRALGLTRGQLRATLLIEALLMGMVGALVGICYGLIYGRLVVAKSFATLQPVITVPWAWLAALVALAALAAVLAAVLPARRAARTSIVAAMADT